jgi:hypothetical protein
MRHDAIASGLASLAAGPGIPGGKRMMEVLHHRLARQG